jgi:hypothetical protein
MSSMTIWAAIAFSAFIGYTVYNLQTLKERLDMLEELKKKLDLTLSELSQIRETVGQVRHSLALNLDGTKGKV